MDSTDVRIAALHASALLGGRSRTVLRRADFYVAWINGTYVDDERPAAADPVTPASEGTPATTYGELAEELGFAEHDFDGFLTWADLQQRGIEADHLVNPGLVDELREAHAQSKQNEN